MKKSINFSSALSGRKKLWLVTGIVLVLITVFAAQEKYFSKKVLVTDPLVHLNKEQGGVGVSDDSTAQESQVEPGDSVSGGRNLQIGPISLNNSAYVTEALDQFVKEQDQANSLAKASAENLSSTKTFSIQDILSNPITYLERFGYDTKISFLNNNRKTTLIKLIDSISRYYISYNKFPDLPSGQDYGDYAWIEELVQKNEMSGVYQYLIKTTEPVAYCGTAAQTGYCYSTNEQDAIIYVRVEKPFESDVCGMEGGLFLLWSSDDNRFGNVCMNEEPSQYGGFDYFIVK